MSIRSISIQSNAGRVIAALSTTRSDLSAGLIQAMRHEAAGMQEHVVRDYLHGQALKWHTGKLAGSIHFGNEVFIMDGSQFKGMSISVGTNIEYGRYHELGFHGVEHVRAHTRQVNSRSVSIRVARRSKKTGELYIGREKTAQGIAFVRAFDRTVNYDGHPYLRPAAEDRAESIREHLQSAAIAAFQRNALND